jgi:hypothetical protein
MVNGEDARTEALHHLARTFRSGKRKLQRTKT